MFWENYNAAPQFVKDLITDARMNDLISGVEAKHQLENTNLGSVVGDYVVRVIEEKDLSAEIQKQLGVDLNTAIQMKQELIQGIYALDGRIQEFIEQGPVVQEVKEVQQENRPVDVDQTWNKVKPQLIHLVEEKDQARLEDTVRSFYGQIRTQAQAKQKLMDSRKIGGLELDEKRAELVAHVIASTIPVYREKKISVLDMTDAQRKKYIVAQTKKLLDETNGDATQLMRKLSLATEDKNVSEVMTSLLALTASKKVDNLASSPLFPTLVKQNMQFRGKPITGVEIKQVTPEYLQMFLQELLIHKLGVEDTTAAEFVSQMAAILEKTGKKEFADMAYYEVKEQRFMFKRLT